MNSLATRTITGILFTGTILFCVIFSPYTLVALLGVIGLLCALEFKALFSRYITHPGLWVLLTVLSYGFFATAYCTGRYIWISPIVVVPGVVMLIHLFKATDDPIKSIGISILGLCYIALPLSLLLLSTHPSHYQSMYIWGVLALVWTNDTLAYVSGSLIGRHKMWEKWSPKKTWEGFAGGIIFTVIGGFVIAYFTSTSMAFWMLTALYVSSVGTLGDYFESMLKRKLEIKDSGNWLPGHGGMLDRFDNLLMVIPGYFVILTLFQYWEII